MKRLFFAVCLVLSANSVLFAQNISPEERDKAVKYLESTRAGVIAATKGLSTEQLNFKAATNKWSVAEVTEHIAAAEDLLRDMIEQKVMTAPARATNEDVQALDEFVLKAVTDRSHKV